MVDPYAEAMVPIVTAGLISFYKRDDNKTFRIAPLGSTKQRP